MIRLTLLKKVFSVIRITIKIRFTKRLLIRIRISDLKIAIIISNLINN